MSVFAEEVWRVRQGDHTQSCELRDESGAGDGWLVLLRDYGEPLFGRRCGDEGEARYVADCLRRDAVRQGWTEERVPPIDSDGGVR